jgi:predicted ATPase/DNA-binding SARP family transcriptional activator
VEVAILGPLEVRDGDTAIDLAGARARVLLLALVVAHGRPLSADRIAELLWRDEPPNHPGNAVQAQISRLRRALQPLDATDRLVTQPAGYALTLDDAGVDAWRFSAAVARAGTLLEAGDAAAAAELLTDALGLWRGAALSDAGSEPFAVGERRRLEDEHAVAWQRLAEARLALGEHTAVIGPLRTAVARHPRDERLHELLMTALYRAGHAAAALDVFADHRTRLVDVGLEPGPGIVQLQQAILRHDVAADAHPASPNPPLPPASSFVGRDDELARLDRLLSSARLITLIGPGGCGKTRLAQEAAARARAFPDGRVIVELAAVIDAGGVATAVAGALRIPPSLDPRGGALAGQSPDATGLVRAFLRDRTCLLVLDNCEHLVAATATLADDLLRSCPQLVVLATSREALHVEGEHLVAVAPLAVPETIDVDADELIASPAAQLFLDRARALDADIDLDAPSARAVATICRRLDGLPLALELAAARVRVLGVTGLAARLDDRFRLLVGGARTALPRQRTLEAVVRWSYDLLDADERRAFTRLSVFAGGAPIPAAETVCGGDTPLDALTALVDKSLVGVEDGPGGRRLVVLETLRDFGRQRLTETTDADSVRTSHARWYAQFANEADTRLRSDQQVEWLERLERERDNLATALDWLLVTDVAGAQRLATDLAWWAAVRGEPDVGAARLERAVAAGTSSQQSPALASLALLLAIGRDTRGPGHITALVDEAAASLEAVDELDRAGRARAVLGYLRGMTGDMAQAERDLAAAEATADRWTCAVVHLVRAMLGLGDQHAAGALERFDELGDGWGMVQALMVVAQRAEAQGRFADAATGLERAARIADQRRLPEIALASRAQLANVTMLLGDHDRARALHDTVLSRATAARFDDVAALAQLGLGMIARREGDIAVAERHHAAALEGYSRYGDQPGVASAGIALARCHLGFCAAERGDAAAAYDVLAGARVHAEASPEPRDRALLAEAVAAADLAAGDAPGALRRLGWADQLRRSLGFPLPSEEARDTERIERAARAAVGASAAQRALLDGRTLDDEAALSVPSAR